MSTKTLAHNRTLTTTTAYTDLLPPLSKDEYERLHDDIAARGCLVPVEVDEDNNVLDGANRLTICGSLGITAPLVVREGLSDDEKKAHALSLNLNRRQLHKTHRRQLHSQLRRLGKSNRQIAEVSGVSESTVRRDLATSKTSSPKTITGRDGKSYPSCKAGKRTKRPAVAAVEAPTGSYELIYADPPWRYDNSSENYDRAIEKHYPTMALEDICSLSVPAATDAVLFMWATNPLLPEALQVMSSWGFEYKTNAVWSKDRQGMGYYFRGQHELLLVGTRGQIGVPATAERPSSVITAKRRRHSQKPEVVYELIEQMYPDTSKIELFARNSREGWECWGNQAPECGK